MSKAILQQALDALEVINSEFICRASHHSKKDRHHLPGECPIVDRHEAAIDALRTELAKPDWISTEERMPPSETYVLCVCNGSPRVLSRELEDDGHESSYRAFWYWDEPANCGIEISDEEVTHWMPIIDLPKDKL